MANFQIFRETTLPGVLEAYSIYCVAPAAKPDFVELYITGSNSSIVKRVFTESDVTNLINTSLSSYSNMEIVADIAARDALTPTGNQMVFVVDATGDVSVASGGATYIYDFANTTWIKISEAESLDISLTWAALQDKPTSTVIQIDQAVADSHTHANKTELDKIGENVDGNFIYNGALPVIAWNSISW